MGDETEQETFSQMVETSAPATTQTASEDNALNAETHQDVEIVTETDPVKEQDPEGKSTVDAYNPADEATRKKWAKLESDHARIVKENAEKDSKLADAERYRLAMDNFDATLKDDPEAYERVRSAWKKKTGEDLGEYNVRYAEKPQVQDQPQQPTKYLTPEEADQRANQVYETREQKKVELDAVIDFVTEFEEMDPRKTDDPIKKKEIDTKYEAAKQIAITYQKLYPSRYRDYKSALKDAYLSLPENSERVISDARTEGEYVGRALKNAGNVGQEGGSSGAKGGNSNGNAATSDDKATAKKYNTPVEEVTKARLKLEGKI